MTELLSLSSSYTSSLTPSKIKSFKGPEEIVASFKHLLLLNSSSPEALGATSGGEISEVRLVHYYAEFTLIPEGHFITEDYTDRENGSQVTQTT